jgi:segregation and condensation protein B
MPNVNALPGLKQILGALVFGANRPLKFRELRECIVEVSEADEAVAVYADVDDKQIREALKELESDLKSNYMGFSLYETAGGYRLRSDAECGRWLKHLLKTKPHRLSHPALETMAIIAYRQQISKADIESVRGVSVSHIIKPLMEMQLVRIVGRSELPGRPFLYGTTQMFLEHFGLKNLKDLDKMAPMILSRQELKNAEAVRIAAKQKEQAENPELDLEVQFKKTEAPNKKDEKKEAVADEQTGAPDPTEQTDQSDQSTQEQKS